MSATPPLGRLHVITDEAIQSRFSHLELARMALEGGADTVQFREKRPKTTRELISIASAMAAACRDAKTLFVVNDRVDVAAAIGAPAVHLGRDDLPAEVVRRLLGPQAILGGTANSLEEAARVAQGPVNYLGVGPVFGTQSKANPAAMLGLANLRRIAEVSPLPVIAIGNIGPENVEEVLATGAYGVAVLSGVVAQEDPAAATQRYRAAVDRALRRVQVVTP
ncbi:MAG: thiamine phosphate synthase [Chloroflexi bacterium]|nr:thiamine phosphate synthase [Chloroflexota bacterium]